MEKKTNFLKKIVTFSAGMVTMAILVTAIIPASAAGNQIAYNQVGIRTFGEQRVTAGEPYIAPNGQEVPSSITYTDAAGGKTNSRALLFIRPKVQNPRYKVNPRHRETEFRREFHRL